MSGLSETTPEQITVYDCEHGFPPPYYRCATLGGVASNDPDAMCSCRPVVYVREDEDESK